jgi:two-component system KDP operon response regulator KdpE
VTIKGQEIRLTPTEFNLLVLFLQKEGQILSFGDILENVWGPEYRNEHHYPRIYVSHLRKKIEPDFKNPTYIHNEYGIGYVFNSQN